MIVWSIKWFPFFLRDGIFTRELITLNQTCIRQGQAQEFGALSLNLFYGFGLLLWTEDDSGLPTGPLTVTQTLQTFL